VVNLRLREAAPTSVNVTVGKRSREYLTDREVERLIEAAKQNRSGHRDATAILVAYRHGLRASELVALRWDDIDLATGRLHVRRAKSGDASVHPLSARESRALRKLLREVAGVDTLVLAGIATDVAVESTARAASDLQYRTIVVSDACQADSDEAHARALDVLKKWFSETPTANEILGALELKAAA
jgi:integrase